MTKANKGPSLIDLPQERLKPRQMEEPDLAPERHGHKAAAKRQAGAMMVGAYVHRDDVMTMQELFLRLRRETGRRVTMQDAIVEGLRDWCAKHGVTGLKMNG